MCAREDVTHVRHTRGAARVNCVRTVLPDWGDAHRSCRARCRATCTCLRQSSALPLAPRRCGAHSPERRHLAGRVEVPQSFGGTVQAVWRMTRKSASSPHCGKVSKFRQLRPSTPLQERHLCSAHQPRPGGAERVRRVCGGVLSWPRRRGLGKGEHRALCVAGRDRARHRAFFNHCGSALAFHGELRAFASPLPPHEAMV